MWFYYCMLFSLCVTIRVTIWEKVSVQSPLGRRRCKPLLTSGFQSHSQEAGVDQEGTEACGCICIEHRWEKMTPQPQKGQDKRGWWVRGAVSPRQRVSLGQEHQGAVSQWFQGLSLPNACPGNQSECLSASKRKPQPALLDQVGAKVPPLHPPANQEFPSSCPSDVRS